jgi:hypothetical protein
LIPEEEISTERKSEEYAYRDIEMALNIVNNVYKPMQ